MDYLSEQINLIDQRIEEAKQLLSDPDMASMAEAEIKELEEQKKTLETSANQPTSYESSSNEEGDDLDHRNAILEVSGAAGGDEAKIWAGDLLRMYTRFAQLKGFRIEELDENIIKIIGRGAFKTFKFEAGVHRVQRVPETEKRGRIHTSTGTVSILPELEDIDLHINPEDISFEAFRSGGHGGQNVNKVSTAVRLVHKPSGIVVTCSTERYQNQNRENAMKLLRAKLWEIEVEKQHGQISNLRATQVGRGMRSEKIRTYNFPQDRMTDHRINKSWHNLPKLLAGELFDVENDMQMAQIEEPTEQEPTE